MKRRALWLTAAILAAILLGSRPVSTGAAPLGSSEWTPQQQWFHDARFGMFIHWGVYSTLEDGEWVMNNRGMTVAEYETLPPQFNPAQFDAADSVALATAAGAKSTTITSTHPAGLAMS